MAFFDFDYKFYTYNQLSYRYRLFKKYVKLILITVNQIRWYWNVYISLPIYGNPKASAWVLGGIYKDGDVIKYNDSLYISLENSNFDNPFSSPKWLLVINNIVGYNILSDYKPTLIEFEYILNLQFGGVFKQPNQAGDSDIKVIRNTLVSSAYLSKTGLPPARLGKTNSSFNISKTGVFYGVTAPTSITLKLNPANGFNKDNVLKFANKLATIGITINLK